MKLPAGPKRLYIDRPAAARGKPAIVVEMVATGERFHAERAEWTGVTVFQHNPDPETTPAFFVGTDAEVTLT